MTSRAHRITALFVAAALAAGCGDNNPTTPDAAPVDVVTDTPAVDTSPMDVASADAAVDRTTPDAADASHDAPADAPRDTAAADVSRDGADAADAASDGGGCAGRDLTIDHANCGRCGNVCGDTEQCAGGRCVGDACFGDDQCNSGMAFICANRPLCGTVPACEMFGEGMILCGCSCQLPCTATSCGAGQSCGSGGCCEPAACTRTAECPSGRRCYGDRCVGAGVCTPPPA